MIYSTPHSNFLRVKKRFGIKVSKIFMYFTFLSSVTCHNYSDNRMLHWKRCRQIDYCRNCLRTSGKMDVLRWSTWKILWKRVIWSGNKFKFFFKTAWQMLYDMPASLDKTQMEVCNILSTVYCVLLTFIQ